MRELWYAGIQDEAVVGDRDNERKEKKDVANRAVFGVRCYSFDTERGAIDSDQSVRGATVHIDKPDKE